MLGNEALDIIAIVNLYAMAVDTQQWALFDRVFVADVDADFGGPHRWQGLESLKRDFAAVHAVFSSTLHVVTNAQVLVNGSTANCMSYVQGRFYRDTDTGRSLSLSGGWYDDVLVRQPNGWRICTRTCRVAWSEVERAESTPQGMHSLNSEAKAGRLKFLQALTGTA